MINHNRHLVQSLALVKQIAGHFSTSGCLPECHFLIGTFSDGAFLIIEILET